uniref:Uncharacterized protein n=1 Tax=Anguilla anguilla TaxID=7936 RepID=A0A0E9T2X2_ANGAN
MSAFNLDRKEVALIERRNTGKVIGRK